MRLSYYLLTALALAGVYISDLLIVEHVNALYGSGADSGLCGGEGFSCVEAARSKYATILGLPIAALGQAYYVVLLILGGVRRFRPESLPSIPDVILASSAVGVLYSGFLATVSIVDLGNLCPLCMGLYGVNLGILAVAIITHPQRGGFFGRLPKLLAKPGLWATVALLGVATLGSQGVYAHRAKAAKLHKPVKAPPGEAQHFEVNAGDVPGRGPEDAPVVIVEFSDFECPFCQRLARALAEAAKARPDLVRYHFRHYPMDQACNPNVKQPFHQDACRAARASICAQRQGRFWEMHDLLFENNKDLTRKDLDGYAQELGVDMELFSGCMSDPTVVAQIQADVEAAGKLAVKGTPTWFANGWQHVGARAPAQIIGIIDEAAKNAAQK